MEKLLNQLIQLGRKPFGVECNSVYESFFESVATYMFDNKPILCAGGIWKYKKVCLRQIVSKESGLRQFVCKSGLITKQKKVHDFMIKHITYSDENFCGGCSMEDPEYYLMICALQDEHKINQFLFDNIKI